MAPQSQAQLGVSSLQQLFVVGFGFSMILAKTLHLVVAGKYVDLSELLSVNIGEPKSHVLLDGRFIFFYFSLVMKSYFLHQWGSILSCFIPMIGQQWQFIKGSSPDAFVCCQRCMGGLRSL